MNRTGTLWWFDSSIPIGIRKDSFRGYTHLEPKSHNPETPGYTDAPRASFQEKTIARCRRQTQ
jgi:hypothetical protein